jgi:GTP-binding protein EngB required for normal cell division
MRCILGPEKSQDMDDIENLEDEGLEVKSQAEQEELFRYGSSDSSIPVSKIPCSGCGAHLHCQDSKLPGFISYEIFNGKKFKELRKIQCQRCVVMKEYNVALKMNINPEDYPKAISHLKDKKAIVVLIVDLTDFPGSIWPNILDLIGSDKRVILVGNKVDLIPQDSHGHLKKIRESMIKTFTTKCLESLDRKPIVLDSLLVSARTGFNIERLINLIFKNWRDKSEYVGGDVYLIGTTNVGKSSIFNLLMDSDLCDVKALCKIDKATIAPVPGTTLNLLKFPIMKPEHTR